MTTERRAASSVSRIEYRIARALTDLAVQGFTKRDRLPPPAYIRRHLAEHADAANLLAGDLISAPLLSYLDTARVRPLIGDADSPPWAAFSGTWSTFGTTAGLRRTRLRCRCGPPV